MGEVMLGGSTVFDVSTGHLAQVKAAVYVLLFLTYRGELPVLFFWGRGFFVDPISPLCHIPHPHLPFSSLQDPTVASSDLRVTALKLQKPISWVPSKSAPRSAASLPALPPSFPPSSFPSWCLCLCTPLPSHTCQVVPSFPPSLLSFLALG